MYNVVCDCRLYCIQLSFTLFYFIEIVFHTI
nr:MAG TPA: hypothetical protein [Caudoviricetes sp.]